jgi:hypothetical protein
MGHCYECQYGHNNKVSVSNIVITAVCTIPVRHEASIEVSVDGRTFAVYTDVQYILEDELELDQVRRQRQSHYVR